MVSLTDANIAFHRSAARGNTEEVRKFLSEKKEAVDALDEHGFTALHYAAQHNQVKAHGIIHTFKGSYKQNVFHQQRHERIFFFFSVSEFSR